MFAWRIERMWMRAWLGAELTDYIIQMIEWFSGIAQPDDRVLIEFERYRRFFHFSFPMRRGDAPRPCAGEGAPTLRIGAPERTVPDGWVRIFVLPNLEMRENTGRLQVPATRYGLSAKEKQALLTISRDSLEKFLKDSKPLAEDYFFIYPRFRTIVDVDVALWCDGQLRGSAVVEGLMLHHGVAEAARRASRDSRFKPLTQEELPRTRIEVTIMHDLHLRLSREALARNAIYPEKGYLLERDSKRGWYLPEVFNVKRFADLGAFLGSLAREKAGLRSPQKAQIRIFEVTDILERDDVEGYCLLDGPMPALRTEADPDREALFKRAAEWLCRIQGADGNIPPIITAAESNLVPTVDWIRLPFTAWALAEFGKATGREDYVAAACRAGEFHARYIRMEVGIPEDRQCLALVYAGHLALALGDSVAAARIAEDVQNHLSRLEPDPILAGQSAALFGRLSVYDVRVLKPARDIYARLKSRFLSERRREELMNLAVWAETANASHVLDTGFESDVARWLLAHQLPSGAFRESTRSDFTYVRGTGKIIEVLANRASEYREAIAAALAWLSKMQYNAENMYFFATKAQSSFDGSFRHDDFNRDAWIDAAGHVLLAGARMSSGSAAL